MDVDILAIREPEQLFTREKIKSEYKDLVKIWHPDANHTHPKAEDIFKKIVELYKKGLEKIESGIWQIPGELLLTDVSGKTYRLKFKKSHSIGLGEVYIGLTTLVYTFKKEHKSISNTAQARIKGFKFADDKMRELMKPRLPEIVKVFETPDRIVMVLKKENGEVLLQDLIDYFKGKIEPKSAAWIISRTLDFVCYCQYANLVHCSINPLSVFVTPETHKGALYGGWGFATEKGKPITSVPLFTATNGPVTILKKKVADPKIDLECARAVGRAILGDEKGFKMHSDTPTAMKTWLCSASAGNAFEDLDQWHRVLKDSFGARRFTKMEVKVSDIYN